MYPFPALVALLLALLFNFSDCANNFTVGSSETTFNATSVVTNKFSNNKNIRLSVPLWSARNLFASLFAPRLANTNNLNATGKESVSLKGYPVSLGRKLGVNAMLSGFIYSLSVFPLVLALSSAFTSPKPYGGFYGRRKRALVNESHLYRHLPLMNRAETHRFLSLFETTLLVNRKIYSDECKQYYSCKVFHSAIRRGTFPTLADFELALLNVFGIVAERYDYKLDLPTVKMYYQIATNAFKGISCSHMYPCRVNEPNGPSSKKVQGIRAPARLSATPLNSTRSAHRSLPTRGTDQ